MNRFWGILLLAPVMVIACSNSEPAENDDDDGDGGNGAANATGGQGGQGGQGGMGVSLPDGCFLGEASCQPVTNEACTQEEACGIGVNGGTQTLSCFPSQNAQQLGQACDPVIGPFCAGTLTCFFGTCEPFCCSDSDCEGVPCTALDPAQGTLGACGEPPMCQPAGASCSASAECCSNDCHAGHCH